ncbi:MAG: hypothetical protein LDL07_05705 [Desulfarculus sp.]|nr:hypothetical protein [Desulfarculus sp.]
MRSLVFDELMAKDLERLAQHLGEVCEPSRMEGVYWLHLPADLLTPEQAEHAACGPHRVALVLEEGSLRLELLVRAQNSLRCACTGYATPAQRQFLLGFMDRLVTDLGLST